MKYKFYFALIVILGLLSLNINKAKSAKRDNDFEKPTIELKETNTQTNKKKQTIKTFIGTDFKWEKYVEIKGAKHNFNLICYGKYDLKKVGSYQVKLILIDENGYATCLSVNLLVQEKEETDKGFSYQEIQRKLENINSDDYLAIAQALVGMKGYCSDVANAFLQKFYSADVNCYNTYDISEEEAKPGDIIYYADGGLGIQHYAIYLGQDKALQGNFEGQAKIKGVYLKNASKPQFKRPLNH